MISIVKSVLALSDERALQTVRDILENEQYLSKQEIAVFSFIHDSYTSLELFPTELIFLTKFPEYKIQYSESVILDSDSLTFYKKEFIERHKNLAISRRLLSMADSVVEKGLNYDQVEELRSYITDSRSTETAELTDLEEYELALKTQSGFKIYIPQLDNVIGSIEKGFLTTIAGYAGNYKSTLALNIATKSARDGKNVVYFSLEMPKRDVMYNVWSCYSGEPKFSHNPIPHDAIRKGKLSDEEKSHLFNVVIPDYNQVVKPNLHILDESDIGDFSEGVIRDLLYSIDDEKPIDIIFVDHVGLSKYYVKNKSVSAGEAINSYVSIFRRLAVNFRKDGDNYRQVAVVLLSQTNRQGWLKARKSQGRYQLNGLSESNELERSSAIVITTYVDDDLSLSHEAAVCLLKSRFGATIQEPVTTYCDPRVYAYGERSVLSSDQLDVNMFDSLLGVSPSDVGMSPTSDSVSLDDFEF